MRLSKGFWQTYKEIPNDAEIPSHQLMMRAGLIHKSGAGLYNYLPMGLRAIKKFEQIIRDEHDKIGCHEITMSVVTPGELWKETGRWDKMGDLMAKFKDKKDQDLCLSPTNEEAVTDIFRKTIKSYKQLPVTLYQINTKFRDEIRPRFGLMRGREFTMKDAYSFHMDKESLDVVYQDIYDCYCRIFDRVGLEYIPVEADGGAMASSDSKTHEFQVVANAGEDAIIYSPESRYAANIEKAQTIRGKLNFKQSSEAMKNVSTPKMATIEDVCSFLKTEKHHSLKSLVYKAVVADKDLFVLALLLGDDDLNEIKLQAFLKADHLVQATEEEMKKLGLVKGFIGPVGIASELVIVFDKQIDLNAAYVVGANIIDTHTENFIPSRDLKSTQTHDLRLAKEGDFTLDGKHQVVVKRGIEVGHVFQLGDKYTKGMSVQVLDKNGKLATPLMGCYGIGVTRVVAAAIEQSHDENGIIWPKAIAPYQIYFATIVKKEESKKLADEIYNDLLKAGFEVLYDDRDQGPGFKFKDADLIGLPIRLVLGERDYEASGELEIVTRKGAQTVKVKKENLVTELKRIWDSI